MVQASLIRPKAFQLRFALTVLMLTLAATVGFAQDVGVPAGNPQSAAQALSRSVHRNLGCRSCHGEMSPVMGGRPDPVDTCARCHTPQSQARSADGHAMALRAGNASAPSCVTCHGSHDVLSRRDPVSRTHPASAPAQCGTCHAPALRTYRDGVHGTELDRNNNLGTATCTSCHTAHSVARPDRAWSTVAPARVASTCAACHLEAGVQYGGSVHAIATARGAPHSGTCVDCHSSHAIPRATGPTSPTSMLEVSGATCGRCHGSVQLTEKHRLPASVVSDFRGSFHGLAGALGDRRVANCASCHGYHQVKPSWDPQSRISPASLPTTCGQCHAGAGPGFARGGIHHLPRTFGHRLVDFARAMYQMMIIGIIGLMFAHNGLDFVRRWKDQSARRRAIVTAAASGRAIVTASPARQVYVRFTLNERLQHWILASSFITLVVTGFMLTFGWNVPWVPAQSGSTIRALTHRIAAVAFMGIAVYHLGYLALTRRGRQAIRDMVPRLSPSNLLCCAASCTFLGPPSRADWKDLIQTMKYNLGWASTRPQFGRFTYAEKMEYVALLWGTVVMIVTGLALWFEVPFLNRFPFWGFELARVVHYYEAILAALAIVVWHFYFTIFNPDVFPLSKTMITGDMSRDEMEREHFWELCAKDCQENERAQQPAAGPEP